MKKTPPRGKQAPQVSLPAPPPPAEWPEPIPVTVEDLHSAAAILDVPYSMVAQARENGCPAFYGETKHLKINMATLVPALFHIAIGDDKTRVMRPQDALASEKFKREKIKRLVDEKKVMPVDDARQEASQAMSYCFEELERMVRELPPVLPGLEASEIAIKLDGQVEVIRKNLMEKFKNIGNGKYQLNK